jgi:hypothetical protein
MLLRTLLPQTFTATRMLLLQMLLWLLLQQTAPQLPMHMLLGVLR